MTCWKKASSPIVSSQRYSTVVAGHDSVPQWVTLTALRLLFPNPGVGVCGVAARGRALPLNTGWVVPIAQPNPVLNVNGLPPPAS